MVFVLLSQVFLHIFRSWHIYKPFNSSFSVPCSFVVLFSWEIFLISFQGWAVCGAHISCAGSKGSGAWCGTRILQKENPFLCDTYWLWITRMGLVFFLQDCVSASTCLQCCPFSICCRSSVYPVFRPLSIGVIPCVDVDSVCFSEKVHDLPVSPSWTLKTLNSCSVGMCLFRSTRFLEFSVSSDKVQIRIHWILHEHILCQKWRCIFTSSLGTFFGGLKHVT